MTALFAGSFDPFTIGHYSIVMRALPLFGHITVAVGHNPDKRGFLPVERRLELIRRIFAGEDRVSVDAFTGLTVDYARQTGADCLLRGVRSAADFEAERNLADINRSLSGMETVMVCALPEHGFVSSSMIRELYSHHAEIAPYMPLGFSTNDLNTLLNQK